MSIEALLVIGACVCALGISLWQFMVAVVAKDLAVAEDDDTSVNNDTQDGA